MSTNNVPRVLFIDDEEILTRMAVRILGKDFAVTAVADPRQALRLLTAPAADFDVVFCDVSMPFMSGPELYRRVHEVKPALAKRIVFITGGISDALERFLGSTSNECLSKPFQADELRAVARRLVLRSYAD
jgi:CheY-like chemotaxis protein